jgi:prolycopene isomerase
MSAEKFDTIVIGAGVAGMTTAAMLAKDFGKKVLVLERAPFIGGRTLSYVGKGNKVVADGVEMDARAFRKSLPLASCYLGKCTPDIETIFEKELLDGRTFEAGGHGMFWGNKSRVSCVMKHLGEFVNLPLNEGLGFIEWQGEGEDGKGQAGITHQVHKAKPYQWMSEEGYQKTMEQLYEMSRTSFEDMAGLMTTSLQDWLESRDLHPEAYDYLKVLAAAQTAQAEPAMTPAGDYLGYMAIAGRIGMNLVIGSVASCDEPGTIAIPQAMEHACVENGGEVRRSTNVREVLIEDGRVTGVTFKSGDEIITAEADNIVCTIPPKYIFNVLPEDQFPAEWVKLLKEKFWGAGLLTGWVGSKKSFLEDIGLDPRSFVFMPGVIRDEGYIGCVDMVMCNFSAWDDKTAKRGPEGKHEYLFSTALTDKEMRDPDKVNRVIELCENWARATFPDWDENVEFIIWTPGPEAYGLWRPIGEKRPPTKSPDVEGLYFAGDQYGERLWGGGIDGAALSGVLCVDEMMGTNLEEEIFPPFHRGIPEVEAA